MLHRTTLLLDESTRKATKQLASRYSCSTSEAIRRAIVRQRDMVFGVPLASVAERKKVLHRLFDLFETNDPAEEVARLKQEDAGF